MISTLQLATRPPSFTLPGAVPAPLPALAPSPVATMTPDTTVACGAASTAMEPSPIPAVPAGRHTALGRLHEVVVESMRVLMGQFEGASAGRRLALGLLFLPNLAARAWATTPSALGAWLDTVARAASHCSLAQLVDALAAIDGIDGAHAADLDERRAEVRGRLRDAGNILVNAFFNDIEEAIATAPTRQDSYLVALERCRGHILALEDARLVRRLARIEVQLVRASSR